MIAVRVFDSSLTLKAEIDNFETLYFERSWYGVGQFGLTIDRSKNGVAELVRGRIVMLVETQESVPSTALTYESTPVTFYSVPASYLGAAQVVLAERTDSVGIITETRMTTDERGTETLTVSGYQLKHILARRIVYPGAGDARYSASGVVETVMKALVQAQAGSGAAAARQIALLSIATDQTRGGTYLVSARYSNLMDELRDAAYATHISPTLTIDTSAGTIVFDVAEGVDRRSSQSVNGRAIFSSDFDTLKSAEVAHSDAAYRNMLIVGGQGVGAARTIVPVYLDTSEPTGIERREVWIDARDLSSSPDLTARGEAKAEEYAREDYFNAQALDCSPLRYRTEYDLGDLCTVSAFGETNDVRISAARESWSHGDYALELTFGAPYPTLTDQVAQSAADAEATLNANE